MHVYCGNEQTLKIKSIWQIQHATISSFMRRQIACNNDILTKLKMSYFITIPLKNKLGYTTACDDIIFPVLASLRPVGLSLITSTSTSLTTRSIDRDVGFAACDIELSNAACSGGDRGFVLGVRHAALLTSNSSTM